MLFLPALNSKTMKNTEIIRKQIADMAAGNFSQEDFTTLIMACATSSWWKKTALPLD